VSVRDLLPQLIVGLIGAGGTWTAIRLLIPAYRRHENRKLELAVTKEKAEIDSIAVKSAGEQIDRLTEEIVRLTTRVQGLDKQAQGSDARARELNELLSRAASNAREVNRLHEEQAALYKAENEDLKTQLAEARRALGQE
jgi:hypothetical protein